MSGSSSASSHSSPSGVRTAKSDPSSEANAVAAAPSRDPCPLAEAVSGGRPEDVEVASSELAARLGRVDLGSGDGPDGRRSRAIPADGDGARRRGVPERVRVDAERAPDLAIRHARAVELGVQLRGDALGPQTALGVVGIPPQREQREVGLGNDVGAVARPPELDERGILPCRRLNAGDPRVQREQRRPRHAVLQAGPRRPPQRHRPRRHSLVERTDPTSESQNLLPREPQ